MKSLTNIVLIVAGGLVAVIGLIGFFSSEPKEPSTPGAVDADKDKPVTP